MNETPPRLNEAYKHNFQTLLRAAEEDDLVLASCLDVATGEPRAVICATYQDDEGMIVIAPLAKLFDGDPYDEVRPPAAMEPA